MKLESFLRSGQSSGELQKIRVNRDLSSALKLNQASLARDGEL